MNSNERLLVEAVESFLSDKSRLGLPKGKDSGKVDVDARDCDPRARGVQYLHGQIDEMFAVKAAELTHHTGVCAAFSKVHSYKYLDDHSFHEAMDKEMTAQGIPAAERHKALSFIPAIIKELSEEQEQWAEADFGFHPDLDEIMKIPAQYE